MNIRFIIIHIFCIDILNIKIVYSTVYIIYFFFLYNILWCIFSKEVNTYYKSVKLPEHLVVRQRYIICGKFLKLFSDKRKHSTT